MKNKLPHPKVVVLGDGVCVKSFGTLGPVGILQLQECNKSDIGSKVNKKDIITNPFTLLFKDQEAVFNLIEDLYYIRSKMKKVEEKRASENNTVGHPDKQRKTPRKRKKR